MIISLSAPIVARCERYGREVVASYEQGLFPRSSAVSGNRGADKDPALQARARAAEWALCVYLAVNPRTLNWVVRPDEGWDLVKHHARIDVKETRWPFGRYLIWTLDVNHLFEDKQFDVLWFVRGSMPDFEVCGWVTKAQFREQHHVADENHKLETGTWYMDKGQLNPKEEFNADWELHSAMSHCNTPHYS
jgi:hypothetical protein